MAKGTHLYTITINQKPGDRAPFEYEYDSARFTLTTASGKARVSFRRGPLYDHSDFVSPQSSRRVNAPNDFQDAMRKMHLMHIMKHNASLTVNRITISIDGEEQIYTHKHNHFPFLHAMLNCDDLDLPDSWRDPQFWDAVFNSNKTDAASDRRFVCLYSFLAGVSKTYEIEEFTCLWTAVNALYGYLVGCYNAQAKTRGHKTIGERSEGPSIGALLRALDMGDKRPTREESDNHRPLNGAMRSFLHAVPADDLPGLYAQLRDHRADRDWIPQGPLGEHLRKCMSYTGMSAYGYLLIEYAYYLRCNYLHGSKTTTLFCAYNDPELDAFRAMNLFLGEFLKEMIPEIFRDDWFTGDMYQAIRRGVK